MYEWEWFERKGEQTMKPSAPNLIRLTGLALVAAGAIFAGIQPIHPPDALSAVTTQEWGIITPLKVVMCLLFLLGWTGLYAGQVKAAGWLGLSGFLLLSLCWALQTGFIFAEAFIVPLLATAAPSFVDGYLGIAAGRASDVNLGVLPALFTLAGILYVLGGLLFGIALFRAAVLPRWPAVLLAAASVLTPAAALFPHQIQRFAAIPVGVAAVALGYALWSQRRKPALEPSTAAGRLRLSQTEV